MQCLVDFVANLAKRKQRDETTDSQDSKAYPSFIVRLSFVIGSFILSLSYKMPWAMLVENKFDYQGIIFFPKNKIGDINF